LTTDLDVIEALHTLVDRCADLLDISAAGLMRADAGGRLTVLVSSSPQTQDLDVLQLRHGQGPSLDCYRRGAPVHCPDLRAAETRWPRFAAATLSAGFTSVHALPMRGQGHTIGALGLFRNRPGPLRTLDAHLAQALAGVAAIALLQVEISRGRLILLDRPQPGLDPPVAREEAAGVLAAGGHVSPEESAPFLPSPALIHQQSTGTPDPSSRKELQMTEQHVPAELRRHLLADYPVLPPAFILAMIAEAERTAALFAVSADNRAALEQAIRHNLSAAAQVFDTTGRPPKLPLDL
jgi:hypothetical protein